LLKSSGGVFEVTVNDKLIYSKKATGIFPRDDKIIAMLKE
jgi:selT/selW/selH-like putative selenoprotein